MDLRNEVAVFAGVSVQEEVEGVVLSGVILLIEPSKYCVPVRSLCHTERWALVGI